MSEHTPGPWFVGDINTNPDEGVLGEIAIMAKDNSSPSGLRCPAFAMPFRPLSVGAPIAMANARLIAAAPELLAALKAYLVAKPQCECSDHSGCPMASARVLARAAIAKAEGAQQAQDEPKGAA